MPIFAIVQKNARVINKKGAMSYKKTFILSLGGSLIVPDSLDIAYLKKFKKFVEAQVKKGHRLIIVAGGGSTARRYRDAGKAVVSQMTLDDLDWLGIHATRLNAHLVRTIFREIAHPAIITNPKIKEKTSAPVIIGAGYRPGNSTDYCAVHLANLYGAKTVINLSNIEYVYTADPRKNKNAEKIESINWTNFRKIVGHTWDPGLHAPFDPIASKHAQKFDLEVIVANGKDLKNLNNVLDGKKFKGTVIKGK
jgi:uridylate kinase